jgi:uncharacterized hydrophobic protein (TIGR00341 family)
MRLVEVITMTHPAREAVLDVLEANDLDYSISDRTDDPNTSATISFPLPAHAVEPIQKQLDDLDLGEDMYTVVVAPETITSERLDNSDHRFEQVEGLGYQGVSRSELHSKAANLTPDLVIYSLMTAISAVVATAGVLLGSTAVLVGSMVIAPLIGPPMATSVATVIDDDELFARSLKFQAIGGMVALISAVGFALLIRSTNLISSELNIDAALELSTHTAPSFLLVVIALSAGFAGAISLSTSADVGLVGVMIAAAVIPPVGIVGVGIAWGRPTAVLGSVAVVLLNVLSINLAAIICLWYLGYHPQSWSDLRKARSTMLRRVIVLVTAVILLTTFLAHLATGSLDTLIKMVL